ncbi:hypothetical protein G8761_22180 [Bacillus sp. C11]|nr:hypothetical protein [Neobacillus terrae]
MALDVGKDGLDLQCQVAEEAPHWLAPGGDILVETSRIQAAKTFEIFASAGLITKIAKNEELDATVVIGTNSFWEREATKQVLTGAEDENIFFNNPANKSLGNSHFHYLSKINKSQSHQVTQM